MCWSNAYCIFSRSGLRETDALLDGMQMLLMKIVEIEEEPLQKGQPRAKYRSKIVYRSLFPSSLQVILLILYVGEHDPHPWLKIDRISQLRLVRRRFICSIYCHGK